MRGIITVGLGFGDESKGAWVDHLCRVWKADLVIRYSGGSQCGHNVQLPNGTRHTFSQFGAGTLAGVPSYFGPQVIVNPSAFKNEAEALFKAGVPKPTNTVVMHPECLVTTVFHQWLNRLKELARSANPDSALRHGSCGHGIGETRSYWLRHGQDAIFAKDLGRPQELCDKLELLKQRCLQEAQSLNLSGAAVENYPIHRLNTLMEGSTLNAIYKYYMHLSRFPFETPATGAKIDNARTIIFEGAQGVLLDEWYGFHPNTTWSTVTPHHALEMAYDLGVKECCLLGLTRCYTTRHGSGPLPSYSRELTEKLVDPGNPHNQWQGGLRCGYLDLPLLKYACQTIGDFDGILMSHADQYGQIGKVCTKYNDSHWLTPPVFPNLDRQEGIGNLLAGAVPEIEEVSYNDLLDVVEETTGRTILGESMGPTYEDRTMSNLPFRVRS